MSGQRPYSIRTRIKTCGCLSKIFDLSVRDHIPLEQGLRPILIQIDSNSMEVRDHIPLEQGLRLRSVLTIRNHDYFVRDHIPLEQGLRPARCSSH